MRHGMIDSIFEEQAGRKLCDDERLQEQLNGVKPVKYVSKEALATAGYQMDIRQSNPTGFASLCPSSRYLSIQRKIIQCGFKAKNGLCLPTCDLPRQGKDIGYIRKLLAVIET